jgi:DNA-binding response OmpR family regulator
MVRSVPDVLVATDADWIRDEIDAALSGQEHAVARVHRGQDVIAAVLEIEPSLVVLDFQIGNMGGVATCKTLRHEERAGRIPEVAIMLLLDREADRWLAREADADGWLIKPLDSFRVRAAAEALLADGTFYEEPVTH